eukprot:2882584-Pyramimonas_sp.AAC.1
MAMRCFCPPLRRYTFITPQQTLAHAVSHIHHTPAGVSQHSVLHIRHTLAGVSPRGVLHIHHTPSAGIRPCGATHCVAPDGDPLLAHLREVASLELVQ